MEHSHVPLLAQKHHHINYFRYVDDILLVFDSAHTNIQAILDDFNAIHPRLLFTSELEHNSINYLDVSIHKSHTSVNFSVYRIPTFSDAIIPTPQTTPPPTSTQR
jgi:hypothetical protein